MRTTWVEKTSQRCRVIIYLRHVSIISIAVMSQIPDDLKYTREHEWVRIEGDTVTVGITDYAQGSLGDVVYVDGLATGATIKAGATMATIESVKAVSDIYAPVSGEVIEVNTGIAGDPGSINREPYGNGWLFRAKGFAPAELSALLDAVAYADFVASL